MEYLLTYFCVALIASTFVTAAVIRVAKRIKLYDKPGPLKIHSGPIARLGGIGIQAGFSMAILPWAFSSGKSVISALLLLGVIWALGLADDLWNLPSAFRLCVQLGTGAGLWIAGWRLNVVGPPLLDLIVTALVFAFFLNSMNLLDGIDGLATGTAAIATAGFLVLSPSNSNVAVFGACLLGACIGLLIFNLPPARIFIGDSGSTFLGAALFFLTLELSRLNSTPFTANAGFLLLAVPLADSLFAIVRRVRSGCSPMLGDRRHYYDLLRARGLSIPSILGVAFGMQTVLVLLTWLCVRGSLSMGTTVVFIAASLGVAGLSIGSFTAHAGAVRDEPTVGTLQEKPTGEF